jgi:hypothetical protein
VIESKTMLDEGDQPELDRAAYDLAYPQTRAAKLHRIRGPGEMTGDRDRVANLRWQAPAPG